MNLIFFTFLTKIDTFFRISRTAKDSWIFDAFESIRSNAQGGQFFTSNFLVR